ncbi:hypothetical protein EG68_02945 [Paragonimus skrjabini miyazakii]|uniref:Neurotransmitter-gated ion-channel ligand-binding domain-containing protein n=1 Tax=Paragonimus skrjabini miyazakii TaxID=59628 RepID=A0A8S9YZB2_9TREM|nr:hypothetical protein EG68_02945 [Paragonimus skrjabini miyazakii]
MELTVKVKWCAIFINILFIEQVIPSSEKRLIKQLIDNYEKAGNIGRPVKNRMETIVVGYGLSLFQLLDLDEKNQILTINVWLKYTWIDQLLRWDPANYSNIREVRIPPRLIWTPDIALYNYVDERLTEPRDVMLNVDYLGRVFWSPPAIFKSNCHIDIRNFPFDYQFCYLRFVSLTQHVGELDLQFLDNRTEVDVSQSVPNNEWTIVARPARKFIARSVECGQKIPDLTFFFYLKRNSAYYAYLLVFPPIFLSFFSTVIFWLPPHVPAKMLLSMNLFVAFSLLLKVLSISTPSASTYVPYLDLTNHVPSEVRHLRELTRIFSIPLSITPPTDEDNGGETLSSMKARIRKLQHSTIQRHGQPQPNSMNRFAWPPHPFIDNQCLQHLNSLPNMANQNEQRNLWRNCEAYRQLEQVRYAQSLSMYGYRPDLNAETMDQMNRLINEQMKKTAVKWSQQSTPDFMFEGATKQQQIPRGSMDHQSSDSNDPVSHDVQPTSAQMLSTRRHTIQMQTSLSELRTALVNMMNKIAKKETVAKRARDWHLVVMTFDRMFFWFDLIVIIGAGLYLLLPRGQSHSVDELIKMHMDEYVKTDLQKAALCG